GLLAYEYIITFDCEMKLFWKRSITGSSILFIANRYLSLVFAALGAPYPDPTTTKVSIPTAFTYGLEFLQYLPWALFSALRAYALSSGTQGHWQWSISTLVLLSSLAPLVINFVGMGYWSVVGTSDGCITTIPLSATIQNQLSLTWICSSMTIISRVCLVTSDLLVMCITWKATYKTSREIKVLGQGTSLSSILLRNGEYWPILATLNILHLSFTLLSIFRTDQTGTNNPNSFIVVFSNPLTAILMSRFFIDLQEAHNAATHQHSHMSSMSSLNFNRVIGSLGSSLPAPGETSEEQSVPQGDDGDMEMERLDNGVVEPDSIGSAP
ncbi:hypothetical protein C8Q74DRAFT_1210254, partial [Fomes fomentarius]